MSRQRTNQDVGWSPNRRRPEELFWTFPQLFVTKKVDPTTLPALPLPMRILRALFLLAGLSALGACAGPAQMAAQAPQAGAPLVVASPPAEDLVAPEPEPSSATVYFAFGRADISASTLQVLWQFGRSDLAHHSQVVVSGHADSSGDPAANRVLSRRRAEAVAAQLVKMGLDPRHLTVDIRGADGAAANSAADRRVDVAIAPEGFNAPSPKASTAAQSPRAVTPALPDDSLADDESDEDPINDPLESVNRSIFDFNRTVDSAVIKPVAVAYRDNVPSYARDRVHDFLDNWQAPLRFCNDIAQGDIDRAVETFIRFTFNTGFGIGGLFDLAGAGGVPNHHTDVGATFGVWGIGEGPYLMLPILGPSNPRDLAGMAVEFEFDPVGYRLDGIDGTKAVTESRVALGGLDLRERNIDTLEDIERTSIDFYATIRSLYRQHREAEIHHRPDRGSPRQLSSLP